MDNDWTVSDELFQFALTLVPEGGTILELGSGLSTVKFRTAKRNVIAVEHDGDFLQKLVAEHKGALNGVEFIHAPIKNYGADYRPLPSIKKRISHHTGWYNPSILQEALRDKHYNLIIVDGPPRDIGRSGFLHHLEIFPNTGCPIIFDDLHRIDDIYISAKVASVLCRDLRITNHWKKPLRQKPNGDWLYEQGKPFGVVM